MCDIVITDDYANQVYCQYEADAQKFQEAHKYSKHGIGKKMKSNNCL